MDQKSLVDRYFTRPGQIMQDVFAAVRWTRRDAVISGAKGVVFEQKDVEAPEFWSDQAVNIVAEKYFRGPIHTPQRETSVKQLIARVVVEYANWGLEDKYFATDEESEAFAAELAYILVHQIASFNSPVWFNVGIPAEWRGHRRPQASACFILSVEDQLEGENGILDWFVKEGKIFKEGSGSGANLSKLRSSHEFLSAGGRPSGPVSFMKTADANAGQIKSGGKCLAPYQPVPTSLGLQNVQALAQSGSDFIILSKDKQEGRIKAKTARAWKSGVKPVVALVTDKGEFHLSEDHPVLLKTGEYRKVSELMPGMSVSSFSLDESEGYIRVHLQNGHKGKEFFHRLIAQDVLGWEVDGKVIHHKNENRFDNNPLNLDLLTQSEHMKLHTQQLVDRGNHVFQNQKFPKTGAQNGMHQNSDFWKDERKVSAYRQVQARILRNRGTAKAMQAKACRQKMLNFGYKLINAGNDISTFNSYLLARKKTAQVDSVRNVQKRIERNFGSYDQFYRELRNENHEVVHIVPIGVMDVYDIEVDCVSPDDKSTSSSHNFGILPIGATSMAGHGIFVSNTRRAAKLVCLDADHGDIEEFIWCKAKEEVRAHQMIDAGIASGNFTDPEGAYALINFQNANNSVRASDQFLQAVKKDGDFWTLTRKGEPLQKYKARQLFRAMAEATHICGDPGMQYDDTMNRWNPVLDLGRYRSTNPCGEFCFLDDSACNLASINLLKFLTVDQTFNIEAFRYAIDTLLLAMEISVGNSGYPTALIEKNSHELRPLGLGYANLGALLLTLGLPYDSDEGRAVAASITSLLGGYAYYRSAHIAERMGPFSRFPETRNSFLRVIQQHLQASTELLTQEYCSTPLCSFARPIAQAGILSWRDAYSLGSRVGYRNAQSTLLAPTGTISFMMGCETTGVEPYTGLLLYKSMVGGGYMQITYQQIAIALQNLGYSPEQVVAIELFISTQGHIVGAPHLQEKHYPIFDTAFGQGRTIAPMGHVKMMAAVQPFLSGAISKTCNVPETATVEDIEEIYLQGWKLGLKAIAIYRDGCKRSQPLSTKKEETTFALIDDPKTLVKSLLPGQLNENQQAILAELQKIHGQPVQRKMPKDRPSLTHKFRVGAVKVYLTMGFYEDGTLGEIFIDVSKEGSTISGLFDIIAKETSFGLQYGVPLEKFVDSFKYTSFEPCGMTDSEYDDLRFVKSIPDYIFRYLEKRFITRTIPPPALISSVSAPPEKASAPVSTVTCSDAPPCSNCGSMMVRKGSCYGCVTCGETSGCS